MPRLLKRIRQVGRCHECREGDWVRVERENGTVGYGRCPNPQCLRGRLLAKADKLQRGRALDR